MDLSLPPGATLDTLLQELSGRLPDFEEGLRGKGLQVTYDRVIYALFVNARPVAWEHTADTPLRGGDRVYLFLPVAGG
jgi:molybdopterin converting factor small subunit